MRSRNFALFGWLLVGHGFPRGFDQHRTSIRILQCGLHRASESLDNAVDGRPGSARDALGEGRPTPLHIVILGGGAPISEIGRLETEWPAGDDGLSGRIKLLGTWVETMMGAGHRRRSCSILMPRRARLRRDRGDLTVGEGRPWGLGWPVGGSGHADADWA